jgi:hemerythrin-like domain-containing protein
VDSPCPAGVEAGLKAILARSDRGSGIARYRTPRLDKGPYLDKNTLLSEKEAHMAQVIETLMDEHRLIEHVLTALDRDIVRLETASARTRDVLGDFATFLRTFADRSHHGKEEDLLFKAMAERGVPVQGGPLGVMLLEHEQGRALVGRMIAFSEGAGEPTAEEWAQASTAAAEFVVLLRNHIMKEDQILYPLGERVLPPGELDRMVEALEEFDGKEREAGTYDAMRGLARKLIAGPEAAPAS